MELLGTLYAPAAPVSIKGNGKASILSGPYVSSSIDISSLGILLIDPRPQTERTVRIPAYPVSEPMDIVGAGDSTSAGLACAVAAGARLEEAAAFGNLVASITVRQIGTTGTATPEQIRARWREVSIES